MQERDSQLAIRFSTPQIFSKFLANPAVLNALRRMAAVSPFLKLERIPFPPKQYPGQSGEEFSPICAGICGSDKAIVRLDKGFTSFFDLPNVSPNRPEPLLKFLARIGGRAFRNSKVLSSFTLGHEIVTRNRQGTLGVLYPVFSCAAKFEESDYCPYCKQGQENLCTRIQEGPVRGMAFGTGVVTGDGYEMGGGFQQKLIASANQFLPADPDWVRKVSEEEALKTLVMTDSYSCAVNAVEMIRDSTSPDTPILIIGYGAIGFCVLDALHEAGYTNVSVVTKYPHQQEIVERYGYHAINSTSSDFHEQLASACGAKLEYVDHKVWFRRGFPVVFECVGNPKSVELSQMVTREKGILIELGLPYKDELDWYQVSRKEITLRFPYWSTKAHFVKALENLTRVSSLCKDVVQLRSVQTTRDVLQAFFPAERAFIKTAIRIDSWTSIG